MPCSFYTGALLASYAVQAEVGDYDPDAVDTSGIPSYIREMEFVPGQVQLFSSHNITLILYYVRAHSY